MYRMSADSRFPLGFYKVSAKGRKLLVKITITERGSGKNLVGNTD